RNFELSDFISTVYFTFAFSCVPTPKPVIDFIIRKGMKTNTKREFYLSEEKNFTSFSDIQLREGVMIYLLWLTPPNQRKILLNKRYLPEEISCQQKKSNP